MPDNATRVLILGHGAMGRAFETLLSARHDVAVWDRDLVTGVETQPLEAAARGREVVMFALPSNPHDELAARLAPCLATNALCVSIAKGLDARGRTPAQVFAQHFGPRRDWAFLYGPMLARELQAGRPGFAMAASLRPSAGARLQALFAGTALHLDCLDDVHGAAWAAILKNVYVPLIGAADGLALGDNLRGFLVAEATRELAGIVEAMGGRADTAYTLAGLGDLVTTATSASSHHRRLGADLATGDATQLAASGANIRSEGVHTVAMVRAHALFAWERFALFALVCDFLDDPARLQAGLDAYLARRFAAPTGR
ncbi:NAD(P)H-dependent glycerol-3-phosphate dehydrogenase [Lysobacter koreensis]|uniref:NAD(P)H-dependent glycerol-3-phosphate dehydrogenase n=1 Tax=Lysobacter koreensis TaxID=266122 RepID=A0ABW2YKJ1_9GAMM